MYGVGQGGQCQGQGGAGKHNTACLTYKVESLGLKIVVGTNKKAS